MPQPVYINSQLPGVSRYDTSETSSLFEDDLKTPTVEEISFPEYKVRNLVGNSRLSMDILFDRLKTRVVVAVGL